MNKRTLLIILGICVALVVVGIVIEWNFIASSEGHAWIGGSERLLATATLALAIVTFTLFVATLGAVLIALYGIRDERRRAKEERDEAREQFRKEYQQAEDALEDERRRFREAQEEARKQFLASQKQTHAALEEGRRQFMETQYAAHLPLLMPHNWEPHGADGGLPMEVNWNDVEQIITIRNAGTGIATNVWGVLLPPERMQTISFQYSTVLRSPLVNGDSAKKYFAKGGTAFSCGDKIGEYTLCLPLDRRDQCIARLTLTCSDVYGRKHASIFDYTTTGDWVNIAFIPNIQHDLGEMDKAKRVKQRDFFGGVGG
jgi:hypothetical protein